MAVYKCAACSRLISVSSVPGGNPVALSDPEKWSTAGFRCASCNALLCDRCAPAEGSHCKVCGGGMDYDEQIVDGLNSGRNWALYAIVAQVAGPLAATMMGAYGQTIAIVFLIGMLVGIVATWKLQSAMDAGICMRILYALGQLFPLVSALALLALRSAALEYEDKLAKRSVGKNSTPLVAHDHVPVRHPPPAQLAQQTITRLSIDDIADILSKALQQPARGWSTYEFGSARDTSARSWIVGNNFPLEVVAKWRTKLPSGFILFLGTYKWLGDERYEDKEEFVLAPGQETLEAIRVGRVDPVNHGLNAQSVLSKLREYDAQYGVELFKASTDSISFRLRRLSLVDVRFAQDLFDFCPDLQDFVATPEELVKGIHDAEGYVSLWWD